MEFKPIVAYGVLKDANNNIKNKINITVFNSKKYTEIFSEFNNWWDEIFINLALHEVY